MSWLSRMKKGREASRVWQEKHDALAPKAGDVAPDFELYDSVGQDQIRLSDFRGKRPVALIFGSWT